MLIAINSTIFNRFVEKIGEEVTLHKNDSQVCFTAYMSPVSFNQSKDISAADGYSPKMLFTLYARADSPQLEMYDKITCANNVYTVLKSLEHKLCAKIIYREALILRCNGEI